MLGAIIGDMAGSVYEFSPWQGAREAIPLLAQDSFFTDDSVLTFAIAKALMARNGDDDTLRENIIDNFHEYGSRYPNSGWGGRFAMWLRQKSREAYNSFGNGSAMRVSPVGWAFNSLDDVEKYARISAAVTHNHPEGIKGAQAVAGSIFLARTGSGKSDIKNYVCARYGYDLERPLAQIRETYNFDETCQGSVPEAITAFLEAENFADAIRNAIWLRGDADTQAAIAGSIAEAFYGLPQELEKDALGRLDKRLSVDFQQWQKWLNERPA